jgi:hypothetical protein
MRKDNTQNYQTGNSRITHFKDFVANSQRERDDLEKVDRSFIDNEDQVHNLPNLTKYKFNRATRKMDDISRDRVKDRIESLDDDGVKHTDRVFKIKESRISGFESYVTNYDEDDNEMMPKGDQSEPVSYSDRDIPESEMDMEMDGEYGTEEDYGDTTSYMFFNNLKTIHRHCSEMMEYDQDQVNDLLNSGHNWAEDHMSSAKEMMTHVNNFLLNEQVDESMDVEDNHNYMFFTNMEAIAGMAEEILEMDPESVDDILMTGHDWAEDHMTSAKENVQQVYEWLKTEIE